MCAAIICFRIKQSHYQINNNHSLCNVDMKTSYIIFLVCSNYHENQLLQALKLCHLLNQGAMIWISKLNSFLIVEVIKVKPKIVFYHLSSLFPGQ